MSIPPIYVCIPATNTFTPARDATYSAAIGADCIDGFSFEVPLADDGSQLIHVTGLSGKPFNANFSALGLAGLPTFAINGGALPAIWSPAYLPIVTAAMDARLTMLDTIGYAAACSSVGCLPVQPYVNGEMGYPCETSATLPGRNDAVLAAAGWTPSGYKAAVLAYVAMLAAHPVMAGKALSAAFFTPDNWPRVNDAGQVVASVDSLALSADLLAAVEKAYTAGPVLYGDTTFGLALPPKRNPFVAKITKADGELVFQVANQSMTQEQFNQVVAALPQTAARWEVHPGQVAMLPAALTSGSGFGG
jgi:hypothetical protein